MKIFLAGPNHTTADRLWMSQLAGAFRQRCTATILTPSDVMGGVDRPDLVAARYLDALMESNLLVVNADDSVDSTTAFAAGVAYRAGVEVVLYRTDDRPDENVSTLLTNAGTFLNCQGDTFATIASKVLREIGY